MRYLSFVPLFFLSFLLAQPNQGINTLDDTPMENATAPGAPKKVVARVGDKTMTLHWNKNPEYDLLGYNVYKASSKEHLLLCPSNHSVLFVYRSYYILNCSILFC